MKSRITRFLLIALVVVLIGIALRYTVLQSSPVPVTVFRVARGPVEETVTNSKAGTIRTRRKAALSPEVGGRVAELRVREGQRVQRGQLLMRLASEDHQARITLAKRTLSAAEAAQREACLAGDQARREYDRYVRLADEQIVSAELLEQFESHRDVAAAGCETAAARVSEAGAALDLARVELAKTEVRAPFDAVVAEVAAEVGEWITPSPPAVPVPAAIELLEESAIYVSAPLDEVDLAKVAVGQTVRVTMDAYPDASFPGRVVRIAPYVLDLEEHSRTFEVEVELEDVEFAGRLLPGTSADVEVILEAKADVLRIPSYALIEGGGVLIVENGELVAREVEVGLRNWAFAEIVGGLQEDDRVVVSLDRAEVKEGATAEIAGETLR